MNNQKNNLFYEETNNSADELIIFLHSNLLSNWIWLNQKDYFDDYNCIYLDIPNHGNSYFEDEFSIEKSAEMLKELIFKKAYTFEKSVNNEKNKVYKNVQNETSNNNNNNNNNNINNSNTNNNQIKSKIKKVHLVGVSLGGQLILYLLAKYPDLIDTAVVSGVNLYENPNEDNINEIIAMMNKLKIDIFDKKPFKFRVKGLLAEYGLEKDYYDFIQDSTEKINQYDLNSITYQSWMFKLPEKMNSITINSENNGIEKGNHEKDNDEKYNNEINAGQNLLVLYGTKEYPKVQKSANLIKKRFNKAQIYSVYRSLHLWNIIDCGWFNETVNEFISEKNIDLNNKPYLNKD